MTDWLRTSLVLSSHPPGCANRDPWPFRFNARHEYPLSCHPERSCRHRNVMVNLANLNAEPDVLNLEWRRTGERSPAPQCLAYNQELFLRLRNDSLY